MTRTQARTPAQERLASVERALARHHVTGNIRSWRPDGRGHRIVSSDGTEVRTRSLDASRAYALGLASASKACELRLHTAEQAGGAVADAVGLLMAELNLGERDEDLLHLLCDAAEGKLADASCTLDEVIEANGKTPADVRSWWTRWGS